MKTKNIVNTQDNWKDVLENLNMENSISFDETLKRVFNSKVERTFPQEDDKRYKGGLLFPDIKPGFYIDEGSSIFTIGSCFARNIELALEPMNKFILPTRAFSAPKSEFVFTSAIVRNGLLNEYTPGTMSQRILYALEGKRFAEETIVSTSGNLCADLQLLAGGGR